jgi:hypothetical protein
MPYQRLVLTKHAARRKLERGIDIVDIRQAIIRNDVIEEYPEDDPYPSCMILGFVGKRPIHVVFADDHDLKQTYVITVYEPDPKEWDESCRRRLTK